MIGPPGKLPEPESEFSEGITSKTETLDFKVDSIASGYYSGRNFFVKKDGTVWSWIGGYGSEQMKGLKDIVSVAGGHAHFLALDKNGSVWSWGDNDEGQRGNGRNNRYNYWIPERLKELSDVIAIEAGNDYSVAI